MDNVANPPTSSTMSSIYLITGCIQYVSPIKLHRFRRNKSKKSKKMSESDHNISVAAEDLIQYPPYLQRRKPSLANISCSGTNSTDSLTIACSSDSLMLQRVNGSVDSNDSPYFQPPTPPTTLKIELLPAEPFYFQNTELSSPTNTNEEEDDEWGYFVDLATGG